MRKIRFVLCVRALAILLTVISSATCLLKTPDVIEYHIPVGFKGPVIVLFDQPGGEASLREKSKVVIDVPSNG